VVMSLRLQRPYPGGMSRTGDWRRFVLRKVGRATEVAPAMLGQPTHAVCFYQDDDELFEVLERWVAEGQYYRQRTVLFATQDRIRGLRQRLAVWDLQSEVEAYDAELALRRFMRDGAPVRELFEDVVLEALGGRSPDEVRCYGELVTVLWQQGNVTGAIALEELWDELLADVPVPLLCAYAHADVGAHPAHADVCRTHSRLHV
jgi:hypothetical protein